jgi:hypothetical protein
MIASRFFTRVLQPAAVELSRIQATLDSPRAQGMLMAIAGQESGWTDRVQVPGGQARGFWQFERSGALHGVMSGPHAHWISDICYEYDIPSDQATVYEAIAWQDPLAYAVARLTLWMDPAPLPLIGDIDGAWATYLRVWKPGKPDRTRWNVIYSLAETEIRA